MKPEIETKTLYCVEYTDQEGKQVRTHNTSWDRIDEAAKDVINHGFGTKPKILRVTITTKYEPI